MKTATTVRENCGDILSDAKDINAERAAADAEAVVADAAETVIEDAAPESAEE
jgi:hypothetical protein